MHDSLQSFAILTWVKAFHRAMGWPELIARNESNESKHFHPSRRGRAPDLSCQFHQYISSVLIFQ